jgi:hypothetical protein
VLFCSSSAVDVCGLLTSEFIWQLSRRYSRRFCALRTPDWPDIMKLIHE